jgi:hypothetical protein
MTEIKAFRRQWNERQKSLRRALSSSEGTDRAIELFMRQHEVLHSAEITAVDGWSYADAIFEGMNQEAVRGIPSKCDHSVAWCVWHAARIEDVTMNMLVAGSQQIFERYGWVRRLKIGARDTGNGMDAAGIDALSQAIDITELRAYRLAVGGRTREIVSELQAAQLLEKVKPERLERILAEGGVARTERGLIDYWSRRTVAGLLLMPPTRHNMVHLNEAWQLKKRIQ